MPYQDVDKLNCIGYIVSNLVFVLGAAATPPARRHRRMSED